MVAWSVSRDGGQTFTEMGLPPLPALPAAQYGDAGDPVLAVDRASGAVYFAGTSERHPEAYKGIPLWKSTDQGSSFTRLADVFQNTAGTDYPWIAVDDWPGTGQHDVYMALFQPTPLTFTVSYDGGNNWATARELTSNPNARSPQIAVGANHVLYAVWQNDLAPSLEMCAVTGRGTNVGLPQTITNLQTTWVPGEAWTRLLRSSSTTDPNDYFKAFNWPALSVNPDANRASHRYLVYADKGINANDRSDVFFSASTNGGVNWSGKTRVNLDNTANDQWMPVIAVKPDGNQLFVGWNDRRQDVANNSMINVHGRFGTIAANGDVQFLSPDFRITTESFPPAFAGTLLANKADGHYDPVWPPGDVSLDWCYDWWTYDPDYG
jgi:hypothetical protein